MFTTATGRKEGLRRQHSFPGLLCAAALATFLSLAEAQFYMAMDPFTGIQVPIPFDGNIVPAPDNTTYDVSLDGPAAVTDAFQPVVTSKTLTLGFQPGVTISSSSTVNFTIRMPTGVLLSLATSGTGSVEANGGIATSGPLSLASSGTGYTSIVQLPSSSVTAANTGTGTLVAGGGASLSSVKFSGSGTGNGYISGVTGSVTVSLTGLSSVFIQSGAPSVKITGSVAGTGQVHYDAGSCSVLSIIPFQSSPCVKDSTIQPP